TLVNGRHDVEVFNRTIPQKLVYKSMGIFFIALSILALMFGFLLITESLPFKMLLFESVSAFGTVGLSLGATPLLSSLGRVIIIVLMYVGRIGPLTLAYAIGERNNQANITYPDARIMVG
ncbi:Trk family potassium uptake protein, partial [bacterium]|nr:Trk family potassium uptake protein [bacterium]